MSLDQIESEIRAGSFLEPIQSELALFSSDQQPYARTHNLPVRYSPAMPPSFIASPTNPNDLVDFNRIYTPFRRDRASHNSTLIADYKKQIKRIRREELHNILQPNPLASTPTEEREYEFLRLILFPPE